MPDLQMVVCVKVVPKPEEIHVNPETHTLERADARSEINPPDMNALEMALELKERHGGRITVLSMGPPLFVPYLRVALAMGADHILLLSDRAFAGADTLATTYTLAQAIRRLGRAELICCGEASSDGATGQVPSGLAEWLNVAQLTLLTRVDIDQERMIAHGRRELSGGYEIVEAPLPCVVSVKNSANEPRFMDYRRKAWAFEPEPLTVWSAADLAADPDYIGWTGSPTIVSGLGQAPTRARKRRFLTGSVAEIAGKLVKLLADAP